MAHLKSIWHWLVSLTMSYVLSAGSETAHSSSQHQTSTTTSRESLPHLIDILRDGSFFETTNGIWKLDFRNQILPILKVEFEQEFGRLKRARADHKGVPEVRPDAFSLLLYGEEDGIDKAMTYYELDRTLTAVQALRWCAEGDLNSFNDQLSQQSWDWLREQFSQSSARIFEKEYADECYALITSVIINDLGKDPQLAEDYKKLHPNNEDISTDNHDMQLEKAINIGMVPSILRIRDELNRDDLRKDILLGIHVGAQCNLGQLAQAENLPASLYPLTRFRNHKRAWKFRFMEQVLDLAGAKGHFDNSHAAVFSETVARTNRDAHRAAEDIIWNDKSPREVYDTVLQSRYDYIRSTTGYTTALEITNPSHRALMRLFCLGGVNTMQLAQIYESALLHTPQTSSIRKNLITHLNNDGLSSFSSSSHHTNPNPKPSNNHIPAIQITYLPALLKGSLDPMHNWTLMSQQITAVATILQYINQIYDSIVDIGDNQLRIWQDQGVTVVERDVFEVMRGFVKTGMFTRGPEGLLAYDGGVDKEDGGEGKGGSSGWAVANWIEKGEVVDGVNGHGDGHDEL